MNTSKKDSVSSNSETRYSLGKETVDQARSYRRHNGPRTLVGSSSTEIKGQEDICLEGCQSLDTIVGRSTQCFYIVDDPWLYDSLENKITPLYMNTMTSSSKTPTPTPNPNSNPNPNKTTYLFKAFFYFTLKMNRSYGSFLFESF